MALPFTHPISQSMPGFGSPSYYGAATQTPTTTAAVTITIAAPAVAVMMMALLHICTLSDPRPRDLTLGQYAQFGRYPKRRGDARRMLRAVVIAAAEG